MSTDPSLLQAALIGYQHQRDQLDAKIAEIRRELGVATAGAKLTTIAGASSKRVRSPEARERMAEGQRKRWAAQRTDQHSAPKKKRKMSAESRERIAEATRKRWAEYRAKKARGE